MSAPTPEDLYTNDVDSAADFAWHYAMPEPGDEPDLADYCEEWYPQ